jgi:DNA-binding beta-propeller fold protein YncE
MKQHITRIAAVVTLGVVFVFKGYVVVIGQTPVMVVLNKSDNDMVKIDPATMKITGRVAVGDGPHEAVISPDGKTAYVANYGAQVPGTTLSIIDLATMKETRRVDLSPLMRPHGLVMIGGRIYFTAETNRAIARYDPAKDKVDWIMGTGQNGSHMIVGTGDEMRFYTANIGSDNVTAFELNAAPPAASRIFQIPVGSQPEAIDLSPDEKEIWTGLNAEGAIDIVDTAGKKFVEKVKIGGRPYRVRFTPDGKYVVNTIWPTREIVVVEAATRKEVRRIKLESMPMGLAFSKDGRTAFVTCVEPDIVLKVDLETGEVTGRVETGKVPDGIDVTGY